MRYVITAVVLYALYFLLCVLGTGTEKKNLGSTNFYSYPEAVQERIRQDERLGKMVPKRKSRMSAFLSNLVLFTVVFILVGLLLGVRSFAEGFVYFLLLGEGLGLFDFLVIDLLWWRHSRRVRIEGIGEEKDYQDIRPHAGSFARGIPMFALAALLAALVVAAF